VDANRHPVKGVEQVKFAAKEIRESSDCRNCATASRQAEDDLVIHAGARDVERLPVNRNGKWIKRFEAGAVPVQRARWAGNIGNHDVWRAQRAKRTPKRHRDRERGGTERAHRQHL
jgi:hypothetical protein